MNFTTCGMAVCFILRSDEIIHKSLLDGLKTSANLERDECTTTFTEAFDLMVRESSEHYAVRPINSRLRGRGGRESRGFKSCLFTQQGRGGRGNPGNDYSCSRTRYHHRWSFRSNQRRHFSKFYLLWMCLSRSLLQHVPTCHKKGHRLYAPYLCFDTRGTVHHSKELGTTLCLPNLQLFKQSWAC